LKKNLSDLVIMSDVDGTLLDVHHSHLPSRGNIEALERFVAKGGRFAIATGRSERYIRHLAQVLPVNFPCIVFNGGGIYDFQKEEYLSKLFFPNAIEQYVRDIEAAFPGCGIVFADEDVYLDIGGRITEKYASLYINDLLKPGGFDEVKGPYLKVFFILPPERARLLYEYIQRADFSGVGFVFSDKHMLEMLPENSSKGVALEQLMESTGIKRENFVAIGDYYNDVEMLKCAGIGVTLSDAPQDIKDIAQMIVRPCAQDSLADLVERLEEQYT